VFISLGGMSAAKMPSARRKNTGDNGSEQIGDALITVDRRSIHLRGLSGFYDTAHDPRRANY